MPRESRAPTATGSPGATEADAPATRRTPQGIERENYAQSATILTKINENMSRTKPPPKQ